VQKRMRRMNKTRNLQASGAFTEVEASKQKNSFSNEFQNIVVQPKPGTNENRDHDHVVSFDIKDKNILAGNHQSAMCENHNVKPIPHRHAHPHNAV